MAAGWDKPREERWTEERRALRVWELGVVVPAGEECEECRSGRGRGGDCVKIPEVLRGGRSRRCVSCAFWVRTCKAAKAEAEAEEMEE